MKNIILTVKFIFILLNIIKLVNCVNDVGGSCRLSIDCSGALDCINNICTGCVLCGDKPTNNLKCCDTCPLDNEGYCGHKPLGGLDQCNNRCPKGCFCKNGSCRELAPGSTDTWPCGDVI